MSHWLYPSQREGPMGKKMGIWPGPCGASFNGIWTTHPAGPVGREQEGRHPASQRCVQGPDLNLVQNFPQATSIQPSLKTFRRFPRSPQTIPSM